LSHFNGKRADSQHHDGAYVHDKGEFEGGEEVVGAEAADLES